MSSGSPESGPERPGNLVVLSAPSGTGKTTLAASLVSRVPNLVRSVSYTTRTWRQDEKDGIDYHFVDRGTFEPMADSGGFLEWAEIYGELYGTGRPATEEVLARGDDLLLVIDVQGARWVRKRAPEALLIFLMPPAYEALLERLRQRGTESTGTEAQRLEVARAEIREWKDYDYLVVNDNLDSAGADVEAVIRAARLGATRMAPVAERIVSTFPPASGEVHR